MRSAALASALPPAPADGRAPPPQSVHTVIQGDRRIARNEDVVLSTLLGSCVAACLWDETAQVGGMNHFLLPMARSAGEEAQNRSQGVHAMELLINDLLKAGARRRGLQAKLFGGAWIREGLTNIGDQNATFAERFLADEGVAVVGGSLRGDRGRRLRFWPMTGRASQIWMARDEAPAPSTRPAPAPQGGGELELF